MGDSFREVLEELRARAATPREQGESFEHLIKGYLKISPHHAYAEVHTWAEWARQRQLDASDTGIDLVATTQDGEYQAIQCKFYEETHTLQKKDIDSFFTASGRSWNGEDFTGRIIVTTTPNWSANADKAIIDQRIPCTRINLYDLERESDIPWRALARGEKLPVQRRQRKPMPHQQEAIRRSAGGVQDPGQGQAHHGLWHRQDLHGTEDRRGPRRAGSTGAGTGALDSTAFPNAAGVGGGRFQADAQLRGMLRYQGRQGQCRGGYPHLRPGDPADHGRAEARPQAPGGESSWE